MSETCTSTGRSWYESFEVAWVYRNASYRETQVPLGRLVVMMLTYTYVSSSEFFRTDSPPLVSRFATASSMASWRRPQVRASGPRSSTRTPTLFSPTNSAFGRWSSDSGAGAPGGTGCRDPANDDGADPDGAAATSVSPAS